MKAFRYISTFISTILLTAVCAHAETGYVATDLLNVRTSPSTGSAVTEILQWGEPVTITYGPSMGWYEIYRNGGCYYVKADYISGGTASGTSYSESYSYSDSSYEESYSYTDTYDSSYSGEESTYTDYYDTTSYSEESSYTDYYDTTSYSEESSYTDQSAYGGTWLGTFTLTAYCSCTRCTGGSGITASGTVPIAGHTVAMGGVPFGTKLLINGNVYTVEDRGTSYGHVDIYFDNHQDAVSFGLQYADVYQIN